MGASTIFSRAFNGKLMILFLVILFIACFVIILFHVYSRWFRNRRHRHRRRRQRQFHHSTTAVAHQGLDLSVMCSIPTFIYESNAHDPSMECAVCLCEFEDKETGRVLPECKHNFHIDCIDPWLRTHSDCPICRTRVESSRVPIVNPLERVVVVTETDRAGEEDLTQVDCPSSTSSSSSPTVDLKIKQPN